MTKFVLLINENGGTPKIWGGVELADRSIMIFWGGVSGGLNKCIKDLTYLHETKRKKLKANYCLAYESRSATLDPESVLKSIKSAYHSTNGSQLVFDSPLEREVVAEAFRAIGSMSIRARAAGGDVTKLSPSMPGSQNPQPNPQAPRVELEFQVDETSDLFKALSGW